MPATQTIPLCAVVFLAGQSIAMFALELLATMRFELMEKSSIRTSPEPSGRFHR
jgi:hypothetical protein